MLEPLSLDVSESGGGNLFDESQVVTESGFANPSSLSLFELADEGEPCRREDA